MPGKTTVLMTEAEYRALPNDILSYSQFKTFDISRNKYYKRYILGEYDNESNSSMILGSIVDCLLTCPEEFDNKFHLMSGNAPVGQWGLYIEQLMLTARNYIKNGVFVTPFTNIMTLAFEEFKESYPDKFKGKDIAYILENYSVADKKTGIVPQDYFQQCLDNMDKTPVDLNMHTKAEKIKDSLVNGKYTKRFFQTKTSRLEQTTSSSTDNIEILSQYPFRFEYRGRKIKILLDRVEVNHTKKTVTPFDLKCVWDSLGFKYTVLKDRYYLQASLYHTGCQILVEELYPDYTLDNNFYFIIADTTLNYHSCVYTMDLNQIRKGLLGFTDSKGRKWSGIHEIMDDIQYCQDNSDYKDSLELNKEEGILKLDF